MWITWFKRIKLALIVLLLLAMFAYIVTFVISNNSMADINFIFLQLTQVPVELVVIASFVVGALAGLLAASLLLYKASRKNKRLQRQYTQHIG